MATTRRTPSSAMRGTTCSTARAGADTMLGGAATTLFCRRCPRHGLRERQRRHRRGLRLRQIHADRQHRGLGAAGPSNIYGTGNALANSLLRQSGDNMLDGGAASTAQGDAATTPSCSRPGRGTATRWSTSQATAQQPAIRCSWSATARRDLHQHRCDPLAGELQRRRVARHHHICERRVDRRDRFQFHLVRRIWSSYQCGRKFA